MYKFCMLNTLVPSVPVPVPVPVIVVLKMIRGAGGHICQISASCSLSAVPVTCTDKWCLLAAEDI